MKYYAAVDEDGTRWLFKTMPLRTKVQWLVNLENTDFDCFNIKDFPGFPEGLTWKDEPVEVELIASDELRKLRKKLCVMEKIVEGGRVNNDFSDYADSELKVLQEKTK